MELTLTGRNFSAKEADDWGLVSRVVGARLPSRRASQCGYEYTLTEGLEVRAEVVPLASRDEGPKRGCTLFVIFVCGGLDIRCAHRYVRVRGE
ncbi:hypothetical protein V8D89_006592 [Ganoderma adspersum]